MAFLHARKTGGKRSSVNRESRKERVAGRQHAPSTDLTSDVAPSCRQRFPVSFLSDQPGTYSERELTEGTRVREVSESSPRGNDSELSDKSGSQKRVFRLHVPIG